MTFDRILGEFAMLQDYVGWTEDDADRVRRSAALVLAGADEMVNDFYDEILRHEQTASVIAGGSRQVERLKQSLRTWIADLCSGPYDAAYAERRWRIGKRHVEIGVAPSFVIAALARLRSQITDLLRRRWTASSEELAATLNSFSRLLDLDLSLIQDSYDTANVARAEPIDETGIRKHKVLSQISERALTGLTMRDLLDRVVVLVAESYSADRCEVLEFRQDPGDYVLRSGYGWPPEQIGHRTFPMAAGTELDYVSGNRRPISTDDWRREERYRKSVDHESNCAESSLWVRIVAEDRLFGFLGVHFRQRRAFFHPDYDFLLSVSNILSTAAARDAEDRRRRDNELRLLRLVEGLPAGAVYLSLRRMIMNSAMEAVTGYDRDELASLEDWQRIVVRDDVEGSRLDSGPAEASDESVTTRTAVIRRKDGQERVLEISTFRSSADEVWLVHDVTEEEHRREREVHAERLAAIGQMITGLAHESRNALQRIRACTEMLEFDLESNPGAMELIGRIGKAQDDLQRLFDEVRSYASPLALERQPARLGTILKEAWDACEPLRVGRNAHLEIGSDDSTCCQLSVDRFRLVQVFRNLLENSLAACSDPVRIEVACREAELGPVPAVEIQFSDNGPGLPDEVKARVFEPFFTTKAKGTGLGMAIAQRIVEMHGGQIRIGQAPRGGAQFTILLPRAAE